MDQTTAVLLKGLFPTQLAKIKRALLPEDRDHGLFHLQKIIDLKEEKGECVS